MTKISKGPIREIINKYNSEIKIDENTDWEYIFFCIKESDFDKLEKELIEYVKDENCEAYGEGMTDSVTGFKIEDNPQMRETEKPKKAEDERDHFADSE